MRKILAILFGFFFATEAFASGSLGRFQFEGFYIEPVASVNDSQELDYVLQNSFLGFSWQHETALRVHMKIGQQKLLLVPSRYGGDPFDDFEFGFIEAFGEYNSAWGRARAGLIPLNFGLEGAERESQLWLRRSLLYQERFIGLRDLGFEYMVEHSGFYTSMAFHNGESGSELDERIWYIGRWGWKDEDWDIGLSGTAGSTSAESSFQAGNPSSITLFDPEQTADWRIALFYGQFRGKLWAFQGQAYTGHVAQNSGNNEFFGGHFDIAYKTSKSMRILLRYDMLDPDREREGDRMEDFVTSILLHNRHETSRLYIEYLLRGPSGSGRGDIFRLVWSLSSDSNPLF